jgi:hypothetical protein
MKGSTMDITDIRAYLATPAKEKKRNAEMLRDTNGLNDAIASIKAERINWLPYTDTCDPFDGIGDMTNLIDELIERIDELSAYALESDSRALASSGW